MRSIILSCAVALMAVGGVACGSSTPVSATPSITDTFSGTVQPLGSDSHNFTVSQFGEVDVTLTAAGPPPTIQVGLGVGSVANNVCSPGSIGSTTAQASSTAILTGNLSPGTYCVTVADTGNLQAAITYTVTVLHP